MKHALASVRALIDDQPVSTRRKTQRTGHLARRQQKLTEHLLVAGLGVVNA
jgi:hypothetical protein